MGTVRPILWAAKMVFNISTVVSQVIVAQKREPFVHLWNDVSFQDIAVIVLK